MTVTQLAMEQFPPGLFGNATFESGVVEIEPGDILALSTNGLPETTDANDEQFGLARMGEIIARRSAAPLSEITESVLKQSGVMGDRQTTRRWCWCAQ